MSRFELGIFEDDPRSVAGAEALALLKDTKSCGEMSQDVGEKWGLDPEADPRVVATRAAIRDEKTFDAYRQREAWVMKPEVEVDLSESVQ